VTRRELSKRWPHIKRYLRIEPSGWVEDELHWWDAKAYLLSPEEQAAGYEEQADFYEFRLEQRRDTLANDPHLRGLVEEWTESMTYCSRRCAADARGEDPGEWVPQWMRRPDLAAAKEARVAKIIAELDARERAEAPVLHLRRAG
jgi:hypothetical protein